MTNEANVRGHRGGPAYRAPLSETNTALRMAGCVEAAGLSLFLEAREPHADHGIQSSRRHPFAGPAYRRAKTARHYLLHDGKPRAVTGLRLPAFRRPLRRRR